jgi:carboxyl-terminal processing protease
MNTLKIKYRNIKKKTKIYVFAILLFCIGAFSTAFIDQDFEIVKQIDIFSSVIRELNINYVDEINPGDLVNVAIDAMLESLDPYTVYYPESDMEEYKLLTTGQYGGIGALILQQGDYVVISDPYENTPAQKFGLKAGDKIIEVNGKSAKGKSAAEVSAILKGQPGTAVKLLILPYEEKTPIEKNIIREEIKLPNIPYAQKVADDIAYIQLSQFTENAAKEVKDAYLKQKEQGAKGLIIDLRGNGGGLLQEAVLIMNIFVDKNNLIVSTKGKIKDRNFDHKTIFPAIDTEVPIVVLVDEMSASASEIAAGSFQDLDRGVIIGQRTYGKGLVQNIVPLSYNTRMKVTIAKYYIPSGRCIQAIDYADKTEGKKHKKVADSTAVAFKTKKGRVVYDKGGIEPDIIIPTPKSIAVIGSLYIKNIFFDFANHFHHANSSIPSVKNFKITNDLYNDFITFVKKNDHDYTTQSESLLSNLKIAAEEEQYFSAIKEDYERLQHKLLTEKENDLVKFKKEISYILRSEIVSRYYYQKGQIEVMLEEDPELAKAIDVLHDSKQYRLILKMK